MYDAKDKILEKGLFPNLVGLVLCLAPILCRNQIRIHGSCFCSDSPCFHFEALCVNAGTLDMDGTIASISRAA